MFAQTLLVIVAPDSYTKDYRSEPIKQKYIQNIQIPSALFNRITARLPNILIILTKLPSLLLSKNGTYKRYVGVLTAQSWDVPRNPALQSNEASDQGSAKARCWSYILLGR